MQNQPDNRHSISLPALVGLSALFVWLGLRVFLALEGIDQLNPTELIRAVVMGLWFDLATLGFLLSPMLLLRAIRPNRFLKGRCVSLTFWTSFGLIFSTLLFGAISEVLFWQEFTTRFNFIAVDYLIYTNEVVGNIVESYPVVWLIAAIVMTATLITVLLSRILQPVFTCLKWRGRLSYGLLGIALPLASWNLANLDQMEATHNAYANELSGNGLFTLAAAMRRNELDYDRFYKTIPQAEAEAVLRSVNVRHEALNPGFQKTAFQPSQVGVLGPFKRRPKNVVMISVESLSAKYLGSYGGRQGLTPNLDRIAREGYRFEKVFASGTRTVRGLDALSLGTPPIPGQAIVRRPGNQHLSTIGEVLEHQGYSTMFIYGGYGYFDNMNTYFNGNDYRVIDRTQFAKSSIVFENIWGVADEVLFNNALPYLDGAATIQRPFFAHIMTTSNHRPFTYPDGRIDIPSPGGREGAIKYTDYAIGQFIDRARQKPWFKDTLFVIVADHCASVAGKTKLPMDRYRIPLIFYAPDLLASGTYPRLISQIDVPPTLLEVLGVQGASHFFGQSVFEAEGQSERAFISNYQQLGYYRESILTVLSPKQQVAAYHIDPETFEASPTKINKRLMKETIAYYQTAARAFKNGDLKYY